jgi:hypothetical protein
LVAGVTAAASVSALPPGPTGPIPPTPKINGGAQNRMSVDRKDMMPHGTVKPIPPKPVDHVHPKTGKPVKDDETLEGPKGEKWKASEYFANMQKWEDYISKHGQSHKTAGQVNQLEKLGYDQQAHDMREQRLKNRPPVPPNHKTFLNNAPPPVPRATHAPMAPKVPQCPGTSVGFNRTWSFDQPLGDHHFGAELGGHFSLVSDNDHKRAEAGGFAKGTLFSHTFTAVDVGAYAETKIHGWDVNHGSADAGYHITLFGHDLSKQDWDSKTNPVLYHKDGTLWQHDWKPEFPTISFPVGPFDVSITVGITLHAQLGYGFSIEFFSVRGDLVPGARLDANIHAGVGIPGVELGVGGDINVIKDDLDIGAQFKLDGDCDSLSLDFILTGEDKLSALAGKLFAYAKVGWGPFSKEWDIDIVKWGSPINHTYEVFSYEHKIPLLKPENGGRVAFKKYRSGNYHYVTSDDPGKGWTLERELGKVAEFQTADTQPLYECLETAKFIFGMQLPTPIHYVSLAANCEGRGTPLGQSGFVWRKGAPQTHPALRCKQPGGNVGGQPIYNYTVSLDRCDAGWQPDGLEFGVQ